MIRVKGLGFERFRSRCKLLVDQITQNIVCLSCRIMPVKRRRNAADCSNLIKARLSNPKNRGIATVKHTVSAPPKKRRQKIPKPQNLPRYCRVRIVCKGVSRTGIRKQLLTRKQRKSKPSSVPDNMTEQVVAPRGLCGGYKHNMCSLHGLNLHRVRATNKRYN